MNACRGWFVTGTDTGVGKTVVSSALVRRLRERGLRAAGMKPIASGCELTPAGLRNEDALALQAEATERWPYELVNPCAYAPAIAPHLAAEQAGRPIDFDAIERAFTAISSECDVIVVEGAGGWRVPLVGRTTLADLAARLGLPVVLVVGLRLGCLNHAFLSAEAIERTGLRLAGWVGSAIDPQFGCAAENLATLREWLPAPCLGVIPHLPGANAATAAPHLELSSLEAGTTFPEGA
jgi:dethiobiotin synthetase